MKQLFALLAGLFSLIPACLHAQMPPDWTLAHADYQRRGAMMQVDSEGNAVLAADRPGYVGQASIFIRKVNDQGSVLWDIEEPSLISSSYLRAVWLTIDAQDNIYVLGYRYAGVNITYTDSILVFKYAPTGERLWRTAVDHDFPGPAPMRAELDENGELYIGAMGIAPGYSLIKLSGQGELVFNVSDASTLNTSFSSMRVRNSRIVMSGPGPLSTLSSIAVWDTEGNYLWGNSAQMGGGSDIEVDENGNSYLLGQKQNQVSSSSQWDIRVEKYDPDGNLIGSFNYDFGNSIDHAVRMTLVNGRLSISGRSISAGAAYFDWITFQTDLNGTKLWDARYDEMAAGDETPHWIVAGEDGEVYVCGQGGPGWPGFGGTLYMQYVFVKYQDGNLIWADANPYQGYIGKVAVADTRCGWYVLGENAMTINHYAESCPCTGDFSEDGVINNTDLLMFLTYFGCTDSCPGDLNGDAIANIGDLMLFLALLNTTCE